jgi:hypothetical protein
MMIIIDDTFWLLQSHRHGKKTSQKKRGIGKSRIHSFIQWEVVSTKREADRSQRGKVEDFDSTKRWRRLVTMTWCFGESNILYYGVIYKGSRLHLTLLMLLKREKKTYHYYYYYYFIIHGYYIMNIISLLQHSSFSKVMIEYCLLFHSIIDHPASIVAGLTQYIRCTGNSLSKLPWTNWLRSLFRRPFHRRLGPR